jgi:hypothetical protein
MRTVAFLLLCGMACAQTKQFSCPYDKEAHLWVDGKNTEVGKDNTLDWPDDGTCPVRSLVKLHSNFIIGGIHYDWCGPTKNAITTCGQDPKPVKKASLPRR